MMLRYGRRQALSLGAAGLASLATGSFSWARDAYTGPNVIIIRFGGGVRRQETIVAETTYAPFLQRILIPRGILFAGMEIEQIEGVDTSHGEGTLHILTGKYKGFSKVPGGPVQRLEPDVPTLFEYLRKHFPVPVHQALLINGEDRTAEEFFTFSTHHHFGVEFRSQVLSLYRFKIHRLRRELDSGLLTETDVQTKTRELERLEQQDYQSTGSNSSELAAFWDRWHHYYGSSGLINPRGDRVLTELAVWAIRDLRPKLLMINYQDPDYVHWGYKSHYYNGITIIDQGIQRLFAVVEQDPEYRDNTVVCIVPDCGRDSNPFLAVPFQHHFNSRSAHEIFALLIGPGIPSNQRVDKVVSQVDIAPTLAQLMGFKTEFAEGQILEEAFV